MTAPPTDAPPMAKARPPVGPGRIAALGTVLALTTGAIGLVGVRDALVSAGALPGPSWIESTIDALDGLKPQWWAVVAGIVMVVAGLWILSVAVRPRPRTAIALASDTGVFMRPRDVKKLAARAADDVDGVISSRVSATTRAASMTVTVTGNDGRIAHEVEEAVNSRLSALDPPPRLKVKARAGVAP